MRVGRVGVRKVWGGNDAFPVPYLVKAAAADVASVVAGMAELRTASHWWSVASAEAAAAASAVADAGEAAATTRPSRLAAQHWATAGPAA